MYAFRDPDLDAFDLTPSSLAVLSALSVMPFATPADLGPPLGRSPERVVRTLRRLAGRGLVTSDRFHFGPSPHDRWYLASPSSGRHLPGRLLPHPPAILQYLLSNMEIVAAAYRCVGEFLSGPFDRALLDFRWHRSAPFVATARFSDGWVGFVWSGVWQVSSRLRQTLLDCRTACLPVEPGSDRRHLPGRWCWLVADAWQAYLVREHLADVGFDDVSVVYDASTGSCHGPFDPISSDGYLSPVPAPLDLAPLDVSQAVAASLYGQPRSRNICRLLLAAEQWPFLQPYTLARLAGCHPSRSAVLVEEMVGMGLLDRTSDGGIHPSRRALHLAARRDRVWRGRPGRHYRLGEVASTPADHGLSLEHESGLGALMARFREAGCLVAPGWRGVENHGSDGSIHPDGLVFLSDGPFGSGWYYVEYERAAQHPSAVRRKFRPLFSPAFTPRFPFLYVCRATALRSFLDAARGLPVAVATTADVRRRPVVGAVTAWMVDREYVGLAA